MANLMTPGTAGTTTRVQSFRAAVEALSPATDSVELWLTPTIEQDFKDRSAFPELQSSSAVSARNASGWSLHFLTALQADLVLADAAQRVLEVPGGLMNAYHGHDRRLRASMKEAVERHALFSASAPTPRHRRNEASERWLGTKAQLQGLGIKVFPGEAGTKPRRLCTVDRRGYWASVSASALLWPGLFEVEIGLPTAASSPPPTQQLSPDLARLSPTMASYRKSETGCFDRIASALARSLQPDVGYRYSKETIDDFMEAMADARAALQSGNIIGRSRDQEIQRAAAQHAKTDKPLQLLLARLRDAPPDPTLGEDG